MKKRAAAAAVAASFFYSNHHHHRFRQMIITRMMPSLHRRRHHYRCYFPPVSTKSVFSAAALLLLLAFASLSFFTPPFLDHTSSSSSSYPNKGSSSSRPHLPLITSIRDYVQKKDASDGAGRTHFHVPTRGGTSKYGLWISNHSKNFFGCSNSTNKFLPARTITQPNRILAIATSGGLNQQRTGITDAVVAARILNATLVVPKLDQKSFWKDASNFAEIFDVDWFLTYLSKDVKILKQLPTKGGKIIRAPYRMRVPRKCTPRCYQNRVLPVLLKKHVVQLSKFDYRLANRLETDLQKLRCRVNYHALRFTDPIQKMGETLVRRMRAKSKHFIALHLRFEPDMLAFSGCYYGGGEKERRELGAIRKRWKTLHMSNPDRERRQGKCPLTPEEVGLMLRALSYSNDVHIYVASGEVYGGEETLASLKALFPNLHSKETLASKEELAPFAAFSSRMAALDFIVCDESDAFVTNNNGNMARILAGRRRYFGHKRTIRPNAKKLSSLFVNRANFTWEAFALKVRTYQRGFMGEPNEVRPGRGEFHENPSTCICENPDSKKAGSGTRNPAKDDSRGRKENLDKIVGEPPDSNDTDEEPDQPDFDYDENTLQEKTTSNGTELEYDLFLRTEEPELEEIFSD